MKNKQTLLENVQTVRKIKYSASDLHRLLKETSLIVDETNIERFSREIELRKKISALTDSLKRERETIRKCESKNDKLNRDYKQLELYLSEANARQNQLEDAVEKLRTAPQIQENLSRATHYTNRSIQSSVQRNRALQQKNARLETEVQSLKLAYADQTANIREKDGRIAKLAKECQTLKLQNDDLQRNVEALQGEYQRTLLQRAGTKVNDIRQTDTQERRPNSRVRRSRQMHTPNMSGHGQLEMHNVSLQTELSRQRSTVIHLQQQLQQLHTQKNELINRLSQIAGSKLTEGNPAIADLSDDKRPTKLAEIYSEVYDNQWTDAFDEQVTVYDRDEKDVVDILLRILLTTEQICQERSDNYLTRMIQSATTLPENDRIVLCKFGPGGNAPVRLNKTLRKVRAIMAPFIKDQIQKDIYSSLQQENISIEVKTNIYINKCLELCWDMSVKDPPVVLSSLPEVMSKVDQNRYRMYTQTGSLVDFVVWPAMLLHTVGPILSKGVVQGKSAKTYEPLDTT